MTHLECELALQTAVPTSVSFANHSVVRSANKIRIFLFFTSRHIASYIEKNCLYWPLLSIAASMNTLLQCLTTVHANMVLLTTSKHSIDFSLYYTVLGDKNACNSDVLLKLKILNGENHCFMP